MNLWQLISRISGLLFCLTLAVSPPIAADEGDETKASELVPADLNGWTIEFTAVSNGGRKRLLTLESEGDFRVTDSKGQEKEISRTISVEEATTVFNATREMFNNFRVKELRGRTEDSELRVKLQLKDGRAIRLAIDPAHLNQLDVSQGIDQVDQVIRQKVIFFGDFARRLDFNKLPGTTPTNRIPENLKSWELILYEGIESDRIYRRRMGIGTQQIWLLIPRDAIALTPQDAKNRYAIARNILNKYQLRSKVDDDESKPLKAFDVAIWTGSGLTFTCDREMLIDMGVLDDLDAWVKDINRRFEARGFKERFTPPWAE